MCQTINRHQALPSERFSHPDTPTALYQIHKSVMAARSSVSRPSATTRLRATKGAASATARPTTSVRRRPLTGLASLCQPPARPLDRRLSFDIVWSGWPTNSINWAYKLNLRMVTRSTRLTRPLEAAWHSPSPQLYHKDRRFLFASPRLLESRRHVGPELEKRDKNRDRSRFSAVHID